ncbi:hypothetical protein RchiOBHm_Chr5g0039921 [Rosa chinensis]|uniref:Uncharacterized protein n=1 Tax=Rosa chinensis TaxID=74649 RepID=A0A2P6QCE4_ROSCH|nr:hypothetical protein RchiOBHm_Chr5g0039921 [Rosa chinensis]
MCWWCAAAREKNNMGRVNCGLGASALKEEKKKCNCREMCGLGVREKKELSLVLIIWVVSVAFKRGRDR